MLIQNVSRKILRKERDKTKEDEIGEKCNMRERLETVRHGFLRRRVGKKKTKHMKINLWRIAARGREVRRE